jgi:hypothetical protein
VGAGEFEVRGSVAGDLQAGAGSMLLAGPVAGDAELQVGELTVSGGGAIAGTLAYSAPAPIAPLEAVTAGKVAFTEQVLEVEDTDTSGR